MKIFDVKTSAHDAVSFAKNCQAYIDIENFEQVRSDALTMSAIQYNLIVLSEALKRIELVISEKNGENNFKEFITLGDWLLEGCDNVRNDKILSTVKNKLPDLIVNLEKLLSGEK